MNITNHSGAPYPRCACGGFRPGLFGGQYKPNDHASVLIKGTGLCLGKRHFEAELYQIKLKTVVVFSSDEEDDRRQGKY